MLVIMIQEMVNLIFIGHLNDAKLLAGVGIGNMIQNVCGLSLVIGLNGALETLVSQANGAGNLALCGVYLNRGRFVLAMTFLPIIIILFQSEAILVGIGQNAEVSHHAQAYVIAYLPGLILSGMIDSQRRFLNMLGYTKIPMICQTMGQVFHVLLCYIFVWKLEMSITGIGIASSITNLIIFLSLIQFTNWTEDIQEAVQWPDKNTFRGIRQYYALGIPSALMLCLEWWAFEAMSLITGYIGVDEQAAQLLIFNIIGILFMFALGIQQVASSLIGKQIGMNNIRKAKEYHKALNFVAFVIICGAVGLFCVFHT